MLHSIQKLAIAAAFGTVLAPAAFADGDSAHEHTVMVLEESFFPKVTYAAPGDTVRFVNASDSEQSIVAKDDNWSVGPIAAQGEQVFIVFAGMKNDFYLILSPETGEAVEGAEETEEVVNPAGAISFSEPPLSN
jgi:plastocyanin